MGFWQRCLVNTLVFLATAGFFPNILHVSSILAAFLAAVVLGLLNMWVKPFLVILSLPITALTLGFFYLVINGVMLELTAYLMGDFFQFSSFSSAFVVAIIISVVNLIITDHID
ncbi:putative membrane protein [Ligilactobacillus sp. WC1T17]|uniref:Membrane protein n=1 Tax=Ligilactobacillus ruminis TaxID=1623 RepID=A0ABY1ABY4_9LACO|nr:putative membrane protein [Ligilactobacillus ruminis]